MTSRADSNESARLDRNRAEEFEILMPLLQAMTRDVQELTRKKPDGVVGGMKIEMINKLLTRVLLVLETEPEHEFLSVLDKDAVPQNSDVTLLLGQFLAAMSKFRSRHNLIFR